MSASANVFKLETDENVMILTRTVWSTLFPGNLERVDFIIESVEEQESISSDGMDDQENVVYEDLSLAAVSGNRESPIHCTIVH